MSLRVLPFVRLTFSLCDREQHRAADVLIASIVTVVTFNVAYRACVVLGTVLLQTAPPRGASGGKTEAFLRVMREVRFASTFP